MGSYTPSNRAAPYQPIPGVPNDPLPPPRVTPNPNLPAYPSAGTPVAGRPVAGATTGHTVVKGDTLWGLSKRYGTTVEAIQQANGLTSHTIRDGQTLQIPTN